MPHKASELWPDGTKPSIGETVSGVILGKNDRGTFRWTPCPQSMNVQNIIARQDKRIAQLEQRVSLLEAENVRLESMLSGGRDSVPDDSEFKTL